MIVDESYTSKTCGKCGTLNENLKSKKVFKCNECDLLIDRDINGARNILIRTFTNG
jgi:putative transposase